MDIRGAQSRHDAREVALQVLYAVELAGHDPGAAFDELVQGGDKRHRDFARKLVMLTFRHKKRMDDLIASKSQRWDLNRMALLDHLLLRLALVELFYVDDVPPKVTINEAIEVAKGFSTDQSGRFINGLLDAIYMENEQEILKVKTAAPRPEKKANPSSGGSKPKPPPKKKE